jgi:uncharacterized membrane protein
MDLFTSDVLAAFAFLFLFLFAFFFEAQDGLRFLFSIALVFASFFGHCCISLFNDKCDWIGVALIAAPESSRLKTCVAAMSQ